MVPAVADACRRPGVAACLAIALAAQAGGGARAGHLRRTAVQCTAPRRVAGRGQADVCLRPQPPGFIQSPLRAAKPVTMRVTQRGVTCAHAAVIWFGRPGTMTTRPAIDAR